jgi:hypothetical protein
MTLPSISTPEFQTVIPSTGENITYRPFLVKEEKILLMALEGNDQGEITRAILNILNSCILSDVDVNKLSTFDVEYLFLNLRGKSVGEVIEVRMGHTEGECKALTDTQIKIDDVEIVGEIRDGKIMLTDEVGVKMRYPTVKDVAKLDMNDADDTFGLVAECVEYIFDKESVYNEFTKQEIIDWVGNLNQAQFKNIASFFEGMPKLSYELSWKCNACGESETRTIEGLQGFFTLR